MPDTEKPSRHRKDLRSYWQKKLQLNNEEYDDRRKVILQRIRRQWPDRALLIKCGSKRKKQLSEWLRPTVSAFSIPEGGQKPTSRVMLLLYTDFALFVNYHYDRGHRSRGRPSMLGNEQVYDVVEEESTFIGGGAPKNAGATKNGVINLPPAVDESVPSPARSRSLSIHQRALPSTPAARKVILIEDSPPAPKQDPSTKLKMQPTSTHNAIREPSSQHSFLTTSYSAKQPIEWNDIEVEMNAAVLGCGTVWITMFDLKAEPELPCEWHDFRLEDLYKQFAIETGTTIDSEKYEFVHFSNGGDGASAFVLSNPGAYKIMLKRFSKAASNTNNVLQLCIRARQG